MFQLFQGRAPQTVSREELESEMKRLERLREVLESELLSRTGDGRQFGYGFHSSGNWFAYPTYDEAVKAAVDHFSDPDAGYSVTKVYR